MSAMISTWTPYIGGTILLAFVARYASFNEESEKRSEKAVWFTASAACFVGGIAALWYQLIWPLFLPIPCIWLGGHMNKWQRTPRPSVFFGWLFIFAGFMCRDTDEGP